MEEKENKLFPKSEKIFKDVPTECEKKNEIAIPNIEKVVARIEKGRCLKFLKN